jgi:regulator of protease activity HflC (stomatin/prohibitin superfamily)
MYRKAHPHLVPDSRHVTINSIFTMKHIIVSHAHVGLLYENGAFTRTLEPGRHGLTRLFDSTLRTVVIVDLRERSTTIKGQEILTVDKVAIRVSLLVYFRVVDAALAVHSVGSYEERIYEDVQLAARRFLATRTLDGILNDRNEISNAVLAEVKNSATEFGVEVLRADVKDLVFPGNLREIMNAVLETERRAEAKLIAARKDLEAQKLVQEGDRMRLVTELEEARAMAESPSLVKLRELRALVEIGRAGGKVVVGTKMTIDD